mmetsp:Transcript_85652/g.239278  ORF Transcript_85652/g.239278 Transcript_85652/m.239278 type:complete len:275 (-) Transcript_85652:329-1153(-)
MSCWRTGRRMRRTGGAGKAWKSSSPPVLRTGAFCTSPAVAARSEGQAPRLPARAIRTQWSLWCGTIAYPGSSTPRSAARAPRRTFCGLDSRSCPGRGSDLRSVSATVRSTCDSRGLLHAAKVRIATEKWKCPVTARSSPTSRRCSRRCQRNGPTTGEPLPSSGCRRKCSEWSACRTRRSKRAPKPITRRCGSQFRIRASTLSLACTRVGLSMAPTRRTASLATPFSASSHWSLVRERPRFGAPGLTSRATRSMWQTATFARRPPTDPGGCLCAW